MDANDAKNELIDKYLRGELSGQTLEDFTQNLKNDTSLKQDVELRMLMVQAIQEHGAAQLKNYIRSKTTQKEIMKVSFRAWYYAAAAVGLILVASTVILLNRPRTSAISNEIVAANDSAKQPEMSADKGETGLSPKPETQKIITPDFDNVDDVFDIPAQEQESLGRGEDLNDAVEGNKTAYPDVVIIASNIPVIPIRVESALDKAVVMSNDTEKPAVLRKKSEGTADANISKAPSIDSAIAWQNARTENELYLKESIAKFKLSFVNTKEAQPMVDFNKNQESADIVVYNLPYDNPLILQYNNKYYLKAGEKYYEFKTNKTGKQNVVAVTEPAIIEALNR
jgi:hypothetical protein